MGLKTFGLMNVDWEQRADMDRLRRQRLERAGRALEASECGALLCFDMGNIRYITATHIGTWAQDKLNRFCLLPRGDEPIMWDFGSAARHHQLYNPWLGERSRAGISTLRGAMSPEAGRAEDVARKIRIELEERGLKNEPLGVDAIELVLAPHGFRVLAEQVEDLAPGLAVQVVPAAPDTLFGDVLEAARIAADGDVVLKMDDDDWYGPDFVADLLLARAYSGAELVGVPDDWHYLEPRDVTVRLGTPVEVYRQFVAGGSTLVDAVLLGQVGGFRSVRRAVDAQLIGAVRSAGGTVFRTHGLGYVMRKSAGGHTWVEDLDELVARPGATTYPGFRPSRLLI